MDEAASQLSAVMRRLPTHRRPVLSEEAAGGLAVNSSSCSEIRRRILPNNKFNCVAFAKRNNVGNDLFNGHQMNHVTVCKFCQLGVTHKLRSQRKWPPHGMWY